MEDCLKATEKDVQPLSISIQQNFSLMFSQNLKGSFKVGETYCGLDFLALLAFFPSVISYFFAQNKGGEPPGPLP